MELFCWRTAQDLEKAQSHTITHNVNYVDLFLYCKQAKDDIESNLDIKLIPNVDCIEDCIMVFTSLSEAKAFVWDQGVDFVRLCWKPGISLEHTADFLSALKFK